MNNILHQSGTLSRYDRGSLGKRIRIGGPQGKRTRHDFLDIGEAILVKAFCDLSLAKMHVPKWVSVITDLKRTKECRNK